MICAVVVVVIVDVVVSSLLQFIAKPKVPANFLNFILLSEFVHLTPFSVCCCCFVVVFCFVLFLLNFYLKHTFRISIKLGVIIFTVYCWTSVMYTSIVLLFVSC